MRVGEVIKNFGLGGAEIALTNRISHKQAGVSTHVVVHGTPDPRILALLGPDVHLSILPRSATGADVSRYLEALGVDVVVIHNPLEALKLARPLAKAGIPFVLVAHNSKLSDSRLRDLVLRVPVRLVNPLAGGHIAVSKPAAAGPWCAGSRHVDTIPLGSELDARSRDSISPWPQLCRVRLISIGRLVRAKGLLPLVHAVSAKAEVMREAGVHLALVGEGPLESAIRRRIDTQGVDDLVSMHPPTQDPGSVLLKADWLIISSRFEGGPLTAYEAAIAGTGIASTPVGIVPEIMADYPNGILVAGSSPKQLRRLLTLVCERGPTRPETRLESAAVGKAWRTRETAPRFYEAVRRASRSGR